MTKTRSTKRSLLLSVVSLLVCFTMLMGTTYAWFTDIVTSENNVIKSGTLDVELYYADGTLATPTTDDGWTAVKNNAAIYKADQLWEPGYTDAKHIKISNEGSLALKYQLAIIPTGEVSKLAEVIDVYYIENATAVENRAALDAYTPVGTLKDLISKGVKQGSLAADTDYTATLVLKMREDADNEYQDLSIGDSFTIQLLATQETAEKDSLGTDYDADAWMPGMQVYNASDLQAAINAGENVTLMNDIELTESIVISAAAAGASTMSLRSAPVAQVIDLNGKTITGNVGRDADGNRVHVIVNNGNAVIKNGVITSAGVNGGSAIYNADGATLTVENVTLNGAPQEGSTWPSYTVNNYGALTVSDSSIYGVQGIIATNNTANTTVNNVIAYRDGWSSGHVFYTSSTAKVTINGGTYTNDGNGVDGTMIYGGETVVNGGTFIVKEGAYFALCSGSKLTVNGGDFSNIKSCLAWGGAMTISGGTFGFNPTTYVADGFKAVQDGSKYIVVSETVDEVVAAPEKFTEKLNEAASAGSGDTTIFLADDIDLKGTTWTPISVDGYHGAGVVTIDGNGKTITGLTAPLFAGGFAGKSGIVIKNLTIADSNIVSTSGLGGGAFIDAADSMHVITLENCHLVNSTVSGERVGGLIGWCSGYAKLDDGPVKAYITVSDCSVIDSDIIGAGSAGAIAGHPGASDYTYTTIENCVVKNVDVVSNDTGSWRTGAIVGTANNGHVVINNVDVENVTLTQNGVKADKVALYGRFVPAGTGTLVIDGVLVAANADDLADAITTGKEVTLDQDITLGKINLTDAITNDVVINANGHKITTTESYGIEVTPGKNVTISNADIEMTKEGDYITYAAGFKIANGDYAGATITLKNCTITMANTDWAYAVNMPAGVKNLNLVIDNCTLEGAIAVQCWGDNNTITITNSELICNYTTNALYTSYCVVLQSDGTSVSENNTLVIDNCEFKYSGIDNFNSPIYSVDDFGTGNTVTVTNCTYGEKVVAN